MRSFRDDREALTDYPLAVLSAQTDDLHLDVGAADGREHLLQLVPHAQHGAAQHVVRAAAQADLALQPHRGLLTVAPPADVNRKTF